MTDWLKLAPIGFGLVTFWSVAAEARITRIEVVKTEPAFSVRSERPPAEEPAIMGVKGRAGN